MADGSLAASTTLKGKVSEAEWQARVDLAALYRLVALHGWDDMIYTHISARVPGPEHHFLFRNFTTGDSHTFGGQYLELVPGERLRYTDKFDDPNLPGELRVTVTLKKVAVGTEVSIVQEGLPDVIPVEACYLGWQESLRNLAKLVEPEIPQ